MFVACVGVAGEVLLRTFPPLSHLKGTKAGMWRVTQHVAVLHVSVSKLEEGMRGIAGRCGQAVQRENLRILERETIQTTESDGFIYM